jgi:hypothetical protein
MTDTRERPPLTTASILPRSLGSLLLRHCGWIAL